MARVSRLPFCLVWIDRGLWIEAHAGGIVINLFVHRDWTIVSNHSYQIQAGILAPDVRQKIKLCPLKATS